jgi:hypothetical protein
MQVSSSAGIGPRSKILWRLRLVMIAAATPGVGAGFMPTESADGGLLRAGIDPAPTDESLIRKRACARSYGAFSRRGRP